jgi:hypothetical protein
MPPQLLIADDSAQKTEFIETCVRNCGPKGLRSIEIVKADTTAKALALFAKERGIVAGFIDYEIPMVNGPSLIRMMRVLETSQKRMRTALCLQTRDLGDSFELKKEIAIEAGADRAISMMEIKGNDPLEHIAAFLKEIRIGEQIAEGES